MKKHFKTWPVALTIAGSDSGGGAGIQADLKTFAALGVHGASVITAITAQNPRRVWGAEGVSTKMLEQQLEAVFAELPPAAVKTGMLFSRGHIEVIVRFLKKCRGLPPLIVDPVMVSTSGTALLANDGVAVLLEELLPLAMLITPNLEEATILTGDKIISVEQMRGAARKMQARFGGAVLLKGGHLKNSREAVDIFFDGKNELLVAAPFVKGVSTHGTGCTYSAAICAAMAKGHRLPEAVVVGKNYVTAAIEDSRRIGRHFVLGRGTKL
jgi:hydroxymethylpyrimidine/phosphomethylpyrimidine kinase